MKFFFVACLCFTLCFLREQPSFSQTINVKNTTVLSSTVKETSGLLNVEGRILTHNDQGGEAKLYEIDVENGNIRNTLTIVNARNRDWEELTQDSLYIYIGDFGNNNGNRTNLRIYRIVKEEYLKGFSELTADSILFTYADQTDFTEAPYNTNFDAEAFVAIDDSLYLFTKNWKNQKTYVYALPKLPGAYQVHKVDSLEVHGLITGSIYLPEERIILLTGYNGFTNPFIWRCTHFTSHRPSTGKNEKLILPLASETQVEGICVNDTQGYYLSSEGNDNTDAKLFNVVIPEATTSVLNKEGVSLVKIFPNPVSEKLVIHSDQKVSVEIWNNKGYCVLTANAAEIDVSGLLPGAYILVIKSEEGNIKNTQPLIVY